MEIRELTCIGCPLGCPLTVETDRGQVHKVTGNTCKRGELYARKEVVNPTRIVTSSVPVEGGNQKVVSVKTREDVPKEKIFAVIEALKGVKVQAPVHIGDVVVSNAADTGVDVVATRNVSGETAGCITTKET
ncbi:DUF1667 domain-containing protein [Lachnospiraceae bacterium]|nr:DUF1667 domain-containing protein [Lachnospiraceae bacterium]